MNLATVPIDARTAGAPPRNWNLLYLGIAVAAGLADVWFIIGWRAIDPRNLSWLTGDSAVSEIGWEFMRSDRVICFPLTWIGRLDYPNGASASYLDFIPLIGTPLRFVSMLLPADFQYLGLYAIVCFALQAYFGLKLASFAFKGDRIATLIGGAFFLIAPVLTKELYGHFALLSQWLVLACLYYYFSVSTEHTPAANLKPFVVLCALAAAIQPYFVAMTIAIGGAAIFSVYLRDRRVAGLVWWSILLIGAALLSLVFFGFIVPGKAWFAGSGYTHYAMNLLAPINPQSPHALFLRGFPVANGWTLAGYNYLGLGVLLLLFVALVRQPTLLFELWSPRLAPLTIVSVVLTLLALSTEVTFGERVLFTVPAPHFTVEVLSVFRASGRLFWPVYYLLVLCAVTAIAEAPPSPLYRRALLAAALIIQFFDVLPVAHGVAAAAQQSHENPLPSAEWSVAAASRHHLVILPAFQCGASTPGGLAAWPHFARLAARNKLTLNSVYLARIAPQALVQDCERTPQDMLRDGFRGDTIYVLSDKLTVAMERRPKFYHDCRRVDSFNLCTHSP